jgi:hypothetical protein
VAKQPLGDSISDDAVAADLAGRLKLPLTAKAFPLLDGSRADGVAKVGKSTFVFLEVERSQKHPSTNVVKYWPWLEDDSSRRMLLIQVFAGNRHRRRLTAWVADKMRRVLGDRFHYCAVDLPLTLASEQQLKDAVASLTLHER